MNVKDSFSIALRRLPLVWIFCLALIATGDFACSGQAIAILEPMKPTVSLEVVKQMIANHDYPQADTELKRLLLSSPGDTALQTLQALNFFHEHKYVESKRIVDHFIATHQERAEVRVLSGLLYITENNLGAAEPEFQTAVTMDANNAAAHYYLGRTLYMRQAIDGSIAEFMRAIELDQNFIQAYDAAGLAYVVKQEPEAAKTWFIRGMKQEKLCDCPRMEWLRLDLAAMLLTYHRGAEAADYLAEAEQINKTNPQVYAQLGEMYFQKQQYRDAIDAYGRLLKLDPSNALAHYFRGRAYHLLKQEQPARDEFTQFTALNQQHTIAETAAPILQNHPHRP